MDGQATPLLTVRGLRIAFGGRPVVHGIDFDVGAGEKVAFDLAETVDLYQRAMASTRRVLGLLAEPQPARGALTALPRLAGAIEFDGVRFDYADARPAVRDFALSIAAGTTVALVGATGAGKSTVFKLLLGLVRPQSGVVRVDGRALDEYDLRALRLQVGWVLVAVCIIISANFG